MESNYVSPSIPCCIFLPSAYLHSIDYIYEDMIAKEKSIACCDISLSEQKETSLSTFLPVEGAKKKRRKRRNTFARTIISFGNSHSLYTWNTEKNTASCLSSTDNMCVTLKFAINKCCFQYSFEVIYLSYHSLTYMSEEEQ